MKFLKYLGVFFNVVMIMGNIVLLIFLHPLALDQICFSIFLFFFLSLNIYLILKPDLNKKIKYSGIFLNACWLIIVIILIIFGPFKPLGQFLTLVFCFFWLSINLYLFIFQSPHGPSISNSNNEKNEETPTSKDDKIEEQTDH
ncbi:MAG: hypothetical protein ABIA04_00380 [Pseudomonadota bacterium]